MKIIDDKIQKIIDEYVVTKYPLIKVLSGERLQKARCHDNAVHIAKRDNCNLALVVYGYKGGNWFIHWINKKDNEYKDNTLGFLNETMTYRLIRDVNLNELYNCDDAYWMHSKVIDTINRNINFPLWLKLLSKERIS